MIETALIVEDHPEAVQRLRDVLHRAINQLQVDDAPTLALAKQAIQRHQHDLYLLDISLPDGQGTDLITEIRQLSPNATVVMTTIFGDDQHVFSALRRGAHGYLLKERPQPELVQSLQGLLVGNPPLSPAIAQRILAQFRQQTSNRNEALTPREITVLKSLARGNSRKEIARELGISMHTVSDYIKSIYQKLNIHSAAEAAVEASKRGLV